MKLDQLKKGLWGYRKTDVYAYITEAEQEFSARLAEQESQHQKSEQQYLERIDALEQELRAVKEQLEQQRSEKMEIASTLMAATQYGESLRRDAREQARREREDWERQLDDARRELDQYRGRIAAVRETVCAALHAMEDQTQDAEQQVEAVEAVCPSHNMTLFERKSLA